MLKNGVRAADTQFARPLVVAALLIGSTLPSTSVGAASAAGSDGTQPIAAKVEADTHLVEIASSGLYKVGSTGSVKVSLTAKAGFHINDQYPYRFKTSTPADGVSYPKPVLERVDGTFEEKTVVFNLPFVASHPGKFAIGGVLSLSVCSAASCITQKAPLAVTIAVQ